MKERSVERMYEYSIYIQLRFEKSLHLGYSTVDLTKMLRKHLYTSTYCKSIEYSEEDGKGKGKVQ